MCEKAAVHGDVIKGTLCVLMEVFFPLPNLILIVLFFLFIYL